ncbi:MAG TPA: ATP synthase F1 subunit epsilon [Candidatus Binataceae bacterium]|nr:ATP synthase F1 subunit epsilon [Candidatus Binataceae bacterium]
MATTFAFKLVTPTGVLFDGQVEQVNAVNPLGEFGVLADHTNYITSLVPGLLTVRTAEGQTLAYLVTGGLVEVKDGVMTALAQTAEPPEKVAPPDETELRSAEERLSQMSMFDSNYDEEKQSVMVLRARHEVAESRRTASSH